MYVTLCVVTAVSNCAVCTNCALYMYDFVGASEAVHWCMAACIARSMIFW